MTKRKHLINFLINTKHISLGGPFKIQLELYDEFVVQISVLISIQYVLSINLTYSFYFLYVYPFKALLSFGY